MNDNDDESMYAMYPMYAIYFIIIKLIYANNTIIVIIIIIENPKKIVRFFLVSALAAFGTIIGRTELGKQNYENQILPRDPQGPQHHHQPAQDKQKAHRGRWWQRVSYPLHSTILGKVH